MYHKVLADGFFLFSVIAIFAAMVGWAVGDVWLASTQWMLVAVVMLLMAIFVKMNTEDDEKILKARHAKTSKVTRAKAVKHVSFRLSK